MMAPPPHSSPAAKEMMAVDVEDVARRHDLLGASHIAPAWKKRHPGTHGVQHALHELEDLIITETTRAGQLEQVDAEDDGVPDGVPADDDRSKPGRRGIIIVRLMCHCTPLECHTTSLVEYLAKSL